jgi:hypothetical protein
MKTTRQWVVSRRLTVHGANPGKSALLLRAVNATFKRRSTEIEALPASAGKPNCLQD